ncbi:hypothetical protein KHQ82_02905 [Mycoplasmatota bacterium]|nr:hypothetical protein KHQ82_02905 [Mycoplasmatota bacterium]
MDNLYESIRKKEKLFWFITLVYLVFNGTFMFPFRILTKPDDYSYMFTIIIGYSFISLIFTGLLKKSYIKVFLLTLFTTAIGMGCRFLLEFGEVSNTVNFTVTNILLFLILIPSFVMFAYLIIPKINSNKKNVRKSILIISIAFFLFQIFRLITILS